MNPSNLHSLSNRSNDSKTYSSHPSSSSIPQAGASSTSPSNQQPSPLYFPVIDKGHLPSAPISGSHDLLSLFSVSSMYDWFVKPYLKPTDPGSISNNNLNHIRTTSNGDLKGKGKADLGPSGLSPAQLENLGQKRMKMEKSYGHFVADVGGRNSIKKDHQLETWISDPNFQESHVQNFMKPFSNEVLSKAFTLQPGILTGFDSSVWVAEEGGPKKRKKKRKQGEMLASNGPSNHHQAHPTSTSIHPSTTSALAHSIAPSTTAVTGSHGITLGKHHPSIDPTSRINHLNGQTPSSHHQRPHHELYMREEDHRKKKRTKLSNSASNTTNTSSTAPSHQVALQS